MLQTAKQKPTVPEFIPKDQHDLAIQKLEEEKAVLRNKNIEYDDAFNEMRHKVHSNCPFEQNEEILHLLLQLNAQTEETNFLRVEIVTAQQMSLQTQNTRFDEKEKELKQAIEGREAQMKEMRHDLSELKVKNIQFEDTVIKLSS
jgi:hypothetical protein